jgi:hypothetical protein
MFTGGFAYGDWSAVFVVICAQPGLTTHGFTLCNSVNLLDTAYEPGLSFVTETNASNGGPRLDDWGISVDLHFGKGIHMVGQELLRGFTPCLSRPCRNLQKKFVNNTMAWPWVSCVRAKCSEMRRPEGIKCSIVH